MNNDQTASVTTFNEESEAIEEVATVSYWAIHKDENFPGADRDGICFALNGEDGDLVITDEQLAALGYTKS